MPKNTKTKNSPELTWVNFLHIYQPPWQTAGLLEKAASQSYDYLFTLLEKYPKFQATLNVTGNLLDLLGNNRPDLLARLRKLVKAKKVELTASAYYHPILPLLPAKEVVRQIELNQAVIKKYFGNIKLPGFYLPEMAYSLAVAKIIKKLGFEYLILDPIHFPGQLKDGVLYELKSVGLKLVFRDRQISTHYPPELIYQALNPLAKDKVLITATDGELYGHFHTDWQGYIEKILLDKNLQVLKVSDYLATLEKKQSIVLRAAAWESSEADLQRGVPYIFWSEPKNMIHKNLWLLANLAIELLSKYPKDQNFTWAREHLDKGLSSCVWWWAADKKPSAFSDPTWHPDMVDQGLEELIRSPRSLASATSQEKLQAEKIYLQVKQLIWFKHWQRKLK